MYTYAIHTHTHTHTHTHKHTHRSPLAPTPGTDMDVYTRYQLKKANQMRLCVSFQQLSDDADVGKTEAAAAAASGAKALPPKLLRRQSSGVSRTPRGERSSLQGAEKDNRKAWIQLSVTASFV